MDRDVDDIMTSSTSGATAERHLEHEQDMNWDASQRNKGISCVRRETA